jgi:hypothetical protein
LLQGNSPNIGSSAPGLGFLDQNPGVTGLPKATLARRAKSYSDFYDAAVGYLEKDVLVKEALFDALELASIGESNAWESHYEDHEHDLLDASLEEYQFVNPI